MLGERARKEVFGLARSVGVLRPRDLAARGIPREYAHRLFEAGHLRRIGHGLYVLPQGPASAHRSLAEVAKAMPRGVICLLSALRFHGLTTQLPSEVWIALEPKSWRPRSAPFAVRVAYFSGPAFSHGVETHAIDGVTARIFSPAKTVADCFKYRNKIGTEVAVEALRDYLKKNRAGGGELWRYAKVCRVTNVMRPYLEAVA